MVQFYINGVIISSICLPDRHSLLTPWQLHSLTTDVGGLVPLLARLEIQTLNPGCDLVLDLFLSVFPLISCSITQDI